MSLLLRIRRFRNKRTRNNFIFLHNIDRPLLTTRAYYDIYAREATRPA